jgi:hypothetical protein
LYGWTNEGNTEANVRDLESGLKRKANVIGAKNVIVEFAGNPKKFASRTMSHCKVPSTFWKELMNQAACLANN